VSVTAPTEEARGGRRRGLPRWDGDPLIVGAAALLGAIVLVAVLAPLIAPFDPDQTDILHASFGPSSAHLLGTDELGRDIFSRLVYGARISLLGPTIVTLLTVFAGTAVAIWSVWVGGRFDRLVSRVLDGLFAFPSLLIAIVAVSVFGPGLTAPVIALAVAYLPYLARVVRSVALRERNLAYVDSCRLMGYSGLRICVRHLLPNVKGMVAAQATIVFASALVDLAALSFIGLGTQPPTPDWGTMVSEGTTELINGAPQQSLAAGGAIVFTVVIVNLLSERLSTRAERNAR
jgi:peptide/nickel transport system permease protein